MNEDRPQNWTPTAKLTRQQILEIRASSDRVVDLAARYGVHPSTISRVRLGQSWAEEPGEVREPVRPAVPDDVKFAIYEDQRTVSEIVEAYGYDRTTVWRIKNEWLPPSDGDARGQWGDDR